MLEATLPLWSAEEDFYVTYSPGTTKIIKPVENGAAYVLDDVELFSESFGALIGAVKAPNALTAATPNGRLEADNDSVCEITLALKDTRSDSGKGLGVVFVVLLIILVALGMIYLAFNA